MGSHSLLHSAGVAQCKTAWSAMPGDEQVRTCPQCEAVAYKIDGLSEEAAAQLVHGRAQRLFRRPDGTFADTDRPCHTAWLPPSYWSAWVEALQTVRMVLQKSPWLVMSMVIITLLPLAGAHALLGFTHLIAQAIGVALLCRVVTARWAELNGEQWQPQRSDLNALPMALVCVFIFNLATGIGIWILVVPGLIAAVNWSLALSFLCIEKRGPIQSLGASWNATIGQFTPIVRYMVPPFLINAAITLISWLSFALFARFSSGDGANLFQAVQAVLGLIVVPFSLTYAPLQVNLYKKLGARAAAAGPPKATTHVKIEFTEAMPEEPILLYSELDEYRRELRKVEVFADGSHGYAEPTESAGGTRLGRTNLKTSAAGAHTRTEIDAAQFEQIWLRRKDAPAIATPKEDALPEGQSGKPGFHT